MINPEGDETMSHLCQGRSIHNQSHLQSARVVQITVRQNHREAGDASIPYYLTVSAHQATQPLHVHARAHM